MWNSIYYLINDGNINIKKKKSIIKDDTTINQLNEKLEVNIIKAEILKDENNEKEDNNTESWI
ncbi:hypothetical protein H8356DRAFT_1360574 [Neocallimastix lanati (nom. inval.)]|nr:hypothetical protein H8356DRAFT_1360574 [Neocallimastix sp. JGI-2020a]